MNYLFIYNNARNLGGVQTLMARLSEGLVREGHSAKAVFFTEVAPAVEELFPGAVPCLSLPPGRHDAVFFPLDCREWLAEHCADAEICVAVGAAPLHFVTANLSAFRRPPAVVEYVVLDTVFSGTGKRLLGHFYSNMFLDRYFERLLPDKDKFFLSDAIRRIYEEKTGARVPEARVMPPPIRTPPRRVAISRRPFRMVSIGRIDTAMKTYNVSTPAVLRALREEGCEIHWDVHGGGAPADTEAFLAEIRRHGMQDRVTWHGELPYAHMGDALENASVFLGMGTAAVEAAMWGIPTLVSVAFVSEPRCYGFLHEVPFGVLGESGAHWLERHSVKDALAELYACSEAEYGELVERDRECAMQYAAERLVAHFIELTREARPPPPFPLRWSVLIAANRLRRRLFGGGGGPTPA